MTGKASRSGFRSSKRAVARPFRAVQRALLRRLFEGGLEDTTEPVQTQDLDASAAGGNRYEPSGYTFVRRALHGMQIGSGHIFLDYGSGKGRAVIQAARYPFDRVIGVEISEQLNRVARANVEQSRDRLRCRDVEIVRADATSWPLPDDVTHVYMYNPLGVELFPAMAERIVESLERRPRRLTIMYVNPVCAEQLLHTGRFELVRTSRGLRPDVRSQTIKVFRSRCLSL